MIKFEVAGTAHLLYFYPKDAFKPNLSSRPLNLNVLMRAINTAFQILLHFIYNSTNPRHFLFSIEK